MTVKQFKNAIKNLPDEMEVETQLHQEIIGAVFAIDEKSDNQKKKLVLCENDFMPTAGFGYKSLQGDVIETTVSRSRYGR